MVSKSERESSPKPETKSIQNLTKEDMRRIAEVTGGKFIDNSNVYNFEVVEVIWPGQLFGSFSLTLRNLGEYRGVKENKDELSLWLRVDDEDYVFENPSAVTFSKKSITIQDPEGANPQQLLTIKPGKITLTQNTELGPKA